MSRSLTVWIDPLDAPPSLQAALDFARSQADSISSGARIFAPSLLLPTHYGPWPQSVCHQNLPPDLLVDQPEDVVAIRDKVESAGVGFGVWGVPYDNNTTFRGLNSSRLAAFHASVGGYYVANFEPTSDFWGPGDDTAAIDAWWGGTPASFWDNSDQATMNGNVGVTVIPNDWGLRAFRGSFGNLVGGANVVLMETYGGPNTPEYGYPNLWPTPSAATIASMTNLPVACILANANLVSQAAQANRIGRGNIHSWFAR